jgi:hypothetical protein
MSQRLWWQSEERALLASLARAGVGLGEIARRMAEAGWPVRNRRARAAQVRTLDISLAGLIDEGEPLSPWDGQQLRRYAEAGKTDEQAAALMARTAAETRALAQAMGLTLVLGRSRRQPVKPTPEPGPDVPYAELTNGERLAAARSAVQAAREAQAARVAAAHEYRMRGWRERIARGDVLA